MTLKKLLKENKNARMVFGKKELEIIFKQLDGINLSQSERNRLSRNIRIKLEFIKEISKFKDEFDLKKGQANKKLIEKVVEIIMKDKLSKKIEAILLFGSRVKGIVTKRSDIDICVVFKHISREEAAKFRIRILSEFNKILDVQVFNILPQKIKREIALNHRILFKNKGFDNMKFTINYLKEEDYFRRMEKIFGAQA